MIEVDSTITEAHAMDLTAKGLPVVAEYLGAMQNRINELEDRADNCANECVLLDSQAAEIEKLKAQLEKYEPKEILSEQCKDCKSEFGHPDNCIGCPEKPIPIPKEQLTGNEMVKKAFEEIKEGELSEILKQSQKDFERPVS
jgi:hypothetical protein